MTDLALYLDVIRVSAPSLLTAGALAIGASLIGVFVLLRRETLLALAMPQLVAVGAAIGLRMNWPPVAPALGTAAAALLLLAYAKSRRTMSELLLPCFYVGGLSLSILIIANSQSRLAEMQHLLAGADVFVTPAQAAFSAPIIVLAGIGCALLWRRWLLLSQIRPAASLAGLRPARWDGLFLGLLASVVIVGTSASGILMVLAMLVLPAATVLPWRSRLPTAMTLAVLAGFVYLLAGFVLSIEMDWPLSQSVAGAGVTAAVVSTLVSRARYT